MTAAPKGIVVLAHTPPPFHGQSFMIARLLEALGNARKCNPTFDFYHVDCRYSDSMETMGSPAFRKGLLAFKYALQTVWLRLRKGARILYYAPAPGKRPAFLRDCLVLSIVRPFFSRIVFQWHAAGLNRWLEESATPVERLLGRWLLRRHSVSIVMVSEKQVEAAYFEPYKILTIPYGIPDICPEFEQNVLPVRLERAGFFRAEPDPKAVLRLLYLSTASREKGVFDAVKIWNELNRKAFLGDLPFCHLTIAGGFPDPREETEFHNFIRVIKEEIGQDRVDQLEQMDAGVRLLGWVKGEVKTDTLREADVFVFPSTYPTESFGVVLAEAAYFGLPCVTYQPLVGEEGLTPKYHCRVQPGDITGMVHGVKTVCRLLEKAAQIRADALEKFSFDRFRDRMVGALLDEN